VLGGSVKWKFQWYRLTGDRAWWSFALWHGPNHSWHLNLHLTWRALAITVSR
jgi:hypothetical protein